MKASQTEKELLTDRVNLNVDSLFACQDEFLVADTQLCKRLCPSVRPSVRRGDRVEKWKNERFEYVCVWSGVWRVDGGWMHPSATIL